MKCPQCGSENLEVISSGPHAKLVCSECYKFVKFLKKSEAGIFSGLKAKKNKE